MFLSKMTNTIILQNDLRSNIEIRILLSFVLILIKYFLFFDYIRKVKLFLLFGCNFS